MGSSNLLNGDPISPSIHLSTDPSNNFNLIGKINYENPLLLGFQ